MKTLMMSCDCKECEACKGEGVLSSDPVVACDECDCTGIVWTCASCLNQFELDQYLEEAN